MAKILAHDPSRDTLGEMARISALEQRVMRLEIIVALLGRIFLKDVQVPQPMTATTISQEITE